MKKFTQDLNFNNFDDKIAEKKLSFKVMKLASKYKNNKTIIGDIAKWCIKNNYMSDKQRQCLKNYKNTSNKEPYYFYSNSNNSYYNDYTEDDYLIGAYELCVGEYGD